MKMKLYQEISTKFIAPALTSEALHKTARETLGHAPRSIEEKEQLTDLIVNDILAQIRCFMNATELPSSLKANVRAFFGGDVYDCTKARIETIFDSFRSP